MKTLLLPGLNRRVRNEPKRKTKQIINKFLAVVVLVGFVLPGLVRAQPSDLHFSQLLGGPRAATSVRYQVEYIPRAASRPDSPLVAQGINENGDMTGWVTGSPGRAWVFTNSTGTTLLANLPGEATGAAWKINDYGQVAGSSGFQSVPPERAIRWTDGIPQDLGTLGTDSEAYSVNNLGHAVGMSTVSSAHGFFWSQATGMVDLAPSVPFTTAYDLNESDQVTGRDGRGYAFLWQNGVLTDLPPPAPWRYSNGLAINENGQIAGSVQNSTGNSEAFARYSPGVGWEVLGGAGQRNALWGINDRGDAVGQGLSPQFDVGFVYLEGTGLFQLNDLQENPVQWFIIDARDINNRGQIAAFARAQDGSGREGAVRLTPITAGPSPTPSPTPTTTPTATPTATATAITISGAISYCPNPNPNPVQGVTMALTGTSGGSTSTDSSGNYTFTVTAGGTYTITPTKTALAPGSAGINTVDVVATQRHFLNLGTPLSGCRLMAANVNGDNTVNTVDAVAIQRFVLIMPNGIANTGKYQFNPVSRSYPGVISNQTAQNYDTLVLGDVASGFVNRPESPSQTAAGDGTRTSEVASTVATVSLPEVVVDQSKSSFLAAVRTSAIDAKNKLVGFQGDFTFDEGVISFQSQPVQNAGLTADNWIVSGNVLPGAGPIRTLRVSAFSTDFAPLSGSGTLFELRITNVSQATQGTQLIWVAPADQLIFIDADLNTQKPGYTAPGSVTPSWGQMANQ